MMRANLKNRVKVVGSNLTSRYETKKIKEVKVEEFYSKNDVQKVIEQNDNYQDKWFFANQKFGEVAGKLKSRDLFMHAVPSYSEISLGGAISTGTHGHFSTTGSISNQVEELIVYSPEKGLIHIKEGQRDFDVLSCAYGAGAAICAAKLRTYQMCFFISKTVVIPFHSFNEQIENIIKENESFYANIYFTSRKPLVSLTKINSATENEGSNHLSSRAVKTFQMFEHIGLKVQKQLPRFIKQQVRLQFTNFTMPTFSVPSHLIHNTLRLGGEFATALQRHDVRSHEVAFDAKNASVVLESLRANFGKIWKKEKSTFPINIRYSGADKALLSPSYARKSLWVDFVIDDFRSNEPLEKAEMWHLEQGLQGRAHPGKFLTFANYDFRRLYPNFNRALATLESMDPNRNLYSNIYSVVD